MLRSGGIFCPGTKISSLSPSWSLIFIRRDDILHRKDFFLFPWSWSTWFPTLKLETFKQDADVIRRDPEDRVQVQAKKDKAKDQGWEKGERIEFEAGAEEVIGFYGAKLTLEQKQVTAASRVVDGLVIKVMKFTTWYHTKESVHFFATAPWSGWLTGFWRWRVKLIASGDKLDFLK